MPMTVETKKMTTSYLQLGFMCFGDPIAPDALCVLGLLCVTVPWKNFRSLGRNNGIYIRSMFNRTQTYRFFLNVNLYKHNMPANRQERNTSIPLSFVLAALKLPLLGPECE
jgi:hypothetical protein